MKIVRAVMIGDVVGEPGLEALETRLPEILKNNNVDFAVVNGENAADGFGMTEATFRRILAAGADVVTSGNHVWEKRDFWDTLETAGQLLRPANYPAGSPGQGWLCVEKAGVSWVIINLQGREFMNVIDCPFRCFDTIVQGIGNSVLAPVTLVDFHAESAREKESLGHYLDGRSSVVAGTHTHVQTADERVLPKGTAYISDLGMTGITASVIGMDTQICLDRMRKQVLYRMEPAARNDTTVLNIQGIIAEINGDTGTAISIKRIQN